MLDQNYGAWGHCTKWTNPTELADTEVFGVSPKCLGTSSIPWCGRNSAPIDTPQHPCMVYLGTFTINVNQMELKIIHGSFGTDTGEMFFTFCGALEFLITNYVSCVVGKILGAFTIESRNNLTARRPYVLFFFNAREQLNCPWLILQSVIDCLDVFKVIFCFYQMDLSTSDHHLWAYGGIVLTYPSACCFTHVNPFDERNPANHLGCIKPFK